jgi:hypothetical protein
MASCEEGQKVPLQQSSSLDQGHPSFSGHAGGRGGRKILLGTLVGVLLVAVLAAVCAVAAVSSPRPNTSDQPHTANAAAVAKAGRSEHWGQERRIFGQRYRNRRVAPSPVPSRPPPTDAGMSIFFTSSLLAEWAYVQEHCQDQCLVPPVVVVMDHASLVRLKR